MHLDLERVRENVQAATTEDLLDRVTVYRNGMEPEALFIMEEELGARGVDPKEIRAHAERRREECLFLDDGTAAPCSFCHAPAVAEGWGWHWVSFMMWGKRRHVVPVFPRLYRYCAVHQPAPPITAPSEPPLPE
jgi:hypothetical protein